MFYHSVKIAAAAALVVAMPAFANAQTVAYGTSSPVVVTALRTGSQYAPWTGAGGYAAQAGLFAVNQQSRSVALQFVNQSLVPATAVTFVVNAGRESHRIVDKGVFSPGVLIEHTFAGFNGLAALPDATCDVAQVEFADGSSWHNSNSAIEATADRRAEL